MCVCVCVWGGGGGGGANTQTQTRIYREICTRMIDGYLVLPSSVSEVGPLQNVYVLPKKKEGKFSRNIHYSFLMPRVRDTWRFGGLSIFSSTHRPLASSSLTSHRTAAYLTLLVRLLPSREMDGQVMYQDTTCTKQSTLSLPSSDLSNFIVVIFDPRSFRVPIKFISRTHIVNSKKRIVLGVKASHQARPFVMCPCTLRRTSPDSNFLRPINER